MKTLKQVLGALSRDMLLLHGHAMLIQGLDGAAQRTPRPQPAAKPVPATTDVALAPPRLGHAGRTRLA